MARKWRPLHGYKWGLPGIHYRYDHSKPFRVKYLRKGRYINIGHFQSLAQATAAARKFLRTEQHEPSNSTKSV